MSLYVADTEKLGKGLFAAKDFHQDEVLFTVRGDLVRHTYDPGFSSEGANWLAVGEGLWMRPEERNLWNYINHSCNPNTGLRNNVFVTAMRDISRDEELTIDYAITEDDPFWFMICQRGEGKCRKIIRSARFLPEKLLQKYQPYTPEFLKKSWEKYHSIFSQ